MLEKVKKLTENGMLLLSVILFASAVNWISDLLPLHQILSNLISLNFKELLIGILAIDFISLLLALGFIWLATYIFNKNKDSLCSLTTIKQRIFDPKKNKAVITLLSPLPAKKDFDLKSLTTLEADIQERSDRNEMHISNTSWRQNLRSLSKNNEVTHLYVIPSKESAKDFEKFKAVINHYRPEIKVEQISSKGIDYIDFRSVRRTLDKALAKAKAENNCEEKNIAVDITSGLKITSIAAATYTLEHKNLTFFYVENLDKDFIILSFDVKSGKSEAPS